MGFKGIHYGDPVHVITGEYSKVPKVYIAGKLNEMAPEYIQNVKRMIDWGEKVRRLNMAVFIPGIDFIVGMMKEWEYNDYFDNSQPWLLASDALFLTPGWETSKGTEKEISYAKEAGIPIFEDIDELNNHFNKPTIINKVKSERPKGMSGAEYLSNCINGIGSRKDDNGKLRYDLVPVYALEGIAKVMTYGASKYGDNNWQGVRPADRYFAACQRHLMDLRKGEHDDPESGLKHLDHAITSLMVYRELLYNTDNHEAA